MTKQEKLAEFMKYEAIRRNSSIIIKNKAVIDNMIKKGMKK